MKKAIKAFACEAGAVFMLALVFCAPRALGVEIVVCDQKGQTIDIYGADGKSFLVTTAKTSWWTDSLEIYTLGKKCGESAFSPSLVVSGAKIYKARWVK